jgi:putative PIN family toxin of toxin-antitoxin system
MKLVLDTQVWLDWLVFDEPAIAPLKAAFADERVEIVTSVECEAELERVLARPLGKKAADKWMQSAQLAEARRVAKPWPVKLTDAERAALPRCADPDDQKFLELAAAAKADVLVTKDGALLALARRAPFRVVTPGAATQLLAAG